MSIDVRQKFLRAVGTGAQLIDNEGFAGVEVIAPYVAELVAQSGALLGLTDVTVDIHVKRAVLIGDSHPIATGGH